MVTDHEDAARGPALLGLFQAYPSLPPAERRVADYIFSRPRDVLARTSNELATLAASSQPAVSRLCARLSTRTFPAFKVRLAQELGVDPVAPIGADGSASAGPTRSGPATAATGPADPLLSDIVERAEADFAVARRGVAALEPEALRRAAVALRNANTVVICGFSLSGSVAWRLASLLHRAGCRARSEPDPNGAPWIEDLAAGDVLVVVSYRGRVPQFLPTVRRVRAHGATVVVLTNEARSDLAALADILLLTRAPAALTDDDYVTGPALYVQLAAARALWRTVLLEGAGA